MDNEKKEIKLDDTQRVRVLSPGMLVAKRFFRNKLAMIGLVIIVCMFLFSFLGGMIIPYSQSQVFYTTDTMKKDYAGATQIKDYQIYAAEGVEMPSDAVSKTILAISKKNTIVESRSGQLLGLRKLADSIYEMYGVEETRNPKALKSEQHEAAVKAGENYFEFEDVAYMFDRSSGKEKLYVASKMAMVCQLSVTAYKADTAFSYEFYENAFKAISNNETKIQADGVSYTIKLEDNAAMIYTEDGTEYAYISNMNINSVVNGVTLTPGFKEAVQLAIADGVDSFEFANEGEEAETYLLTRKDGQYLIQRYQETRVIDTYASPSKEHWLGTDANGMDLLARLMYGGRISLLIGFVVIFIEVIIGVIVGGIAGFFGGWIDNLMMRVVDIVYCIPAMPLYLILGSIMDHYKASATVRIYMLCVVMSIIGWVGIARIVRGQILSLREQEFMVATEATGIRVSKRIFKHLVPNVIPQLIVFATMGLGDVILAEASLSFLGLGIKYPAASWGSIINAVNDSYVMTNYLFVWVPAGLLILLTVLAFNFIGDGLRDAFDPKMKR